MSDNLRGALLMSVAMLVFTLNDACMKAVFQTLPLFQAIMIRGVMATAGLLLIAVAARQLVLRPGGRDGAILTLRSAAELAATVLFLVALTRMPLANLSAVMQFLPLAVTLGGALVYRDRVGWRRMTAILIGFAGVMLIIRPGTDGFDIWSLMALGSVAAVTICDLSVRSLSGRMPSMTVAVWAAAAVTLMGAIGTVFQGTAEIGLRDALLLSAAAANLIIGYLTVVMVMRVGDIGFIAPFRYTSLVWAIVLGWLAFGTLPDLLTLAGAGLVIATGLFTLYRERRQKGVQALARQG